MSTVLADIGGTYLRLAHLNSPSDIARYKIADYPDFESVLRGYAPDISDLYMATAIHPRGGLIEDKRFGDRTHWTIDLSALKSNLNLKDLSVLNDLEAATYALPSLDEKNLTTLIPKRDDKPHFKNPPRLLVGIGTGIGHAYLMNENAQPFVQRSHGGHMPALAQTDEQHSIIKNLAALRTDRDIIAEDVISGYGIANLKNLVSEEDALRLFWEFLGLYLNTLASACGAYRGIYLTGGVIDDLTAQGKIDADTLETWFRRPMVPVVAESLASTPVYYCHESNMPIAGLAAYATR